VDIELSLGELIVWTGKPTEYSQFFRRVIYEVVGKECVKDASWATHVYKLRPAYDIENPTGTDMTTFTYMGTRELKRLTLVDVGIMRLAFDNFIKQWSNDADK